MVEKICLPSASYLLAALVPRRYLPRSLLSVEIVRFYFLQFDVSFSERGETGSKGPKVFKIKLTKVAEINPEYVGFSLHGGRPSPLFTQSPTALYRGRSVP